MSSRSAISASILARSSMIFCRSRAARRRSCMSRMAWAWISSTSSNSIRPVRAMSTVCDARINAITSSRASRALTKPRKMCARSFALRNRYRVRRMMTSNW
ncbi:Uncharacterised protein [Mycobacteroides abscessus subsp. abscessus]|nr:Uncharacterised protein [Mycobacteroides abscessus subsp. abscessus]